MALPTKERTWEFDVNRTYQVLAVGEETAARYGTQMFKNQLIGASHIGYQGTISEIAAGVTYQLQVSEQGGDPTVGGSGDFTSDLIGKYFEMVGATTGANNGVFQITAVPATDTIQYAHSGGVAEPFNGSIRISNGKFTCGAGSTQATETLTFTGNPNNDETVTIAARVYTFKTVLDPTAPNTVFIGATASDSLDNLIAAINRDAGEGTLYGGSTRDNFEVTAAAGAGDTMDVTARPRGIRGNSISVSTTVTGASWIGAFLAGGLNGHFPAWRCKGSYGTGKGSGMDGIDRYVNYTDINSTTSGTAITWYVFRNEVTGAEMCFFEDTNSTAYQWQHKEIWLSPENGFTGGGAGVRPTATDQYLASSNGSDWMGHDFPQDQTWIFHMMHSDDGESTRFFGYAWGNGYFAFLSDVAKDANKNGALIPWNGSQNVIDWSKVTSGDISTIQQYSDNAQMRATFDKDASAGGPYLASMYLAAESYVSAPLMENFLDVRDELHNEFIITPFNGLVCTTVGIRGRHGRIADSWVTNARATFHFPQGSTFPADGSHQFVKLGHFVHPWDGSGPAQIK